jgi:hypothetical protein
MRRSLARFSAPESPVRTRHSADFIITTPGSRSHGEVDSDRRSGRVRLRTLALETTAQVIADRPEAPSAIRTNLGAIFASLELNHSTWLITSLSPGSGEKMSKHVVHGGDIAGLLQRFAQFREKALARTGRNFPIIVIHEAGLDGFWIDRVLKNEGIESHVVDPASVATSRRRRPAATGIHRRNDAQKARLAEDVWKMRIHLPIIILASLHPTAIADTAPKFDIARVCQSEGGSNEEQKRCADDELNEASNQRHPA